MKFLKEVLSEENGKYSLSRTMASLLTISYIIAFFIELIKYHQIIDIPPALSMLIAGLYGLNKFSAVIKK